MTESLKSAERYYSENFPVKLTFHKLVHAGVLVDHDAGVARIMADFGPGKGVQFIADIHGEKQVSFVRELCRRWNHSVKRESALMDIKAMAGKRKTCIRMPNGNMLDTFCGSALLEEKL